MAKSFVVSVPDQGLIDLLTPHVSDVELVVWDLEGPAPLPEIDIVVPPYMASPGLLHQLTTTSTRLVQYASIGFDGVAAVLPPGIVLANAATVHESSTAELALALILASQRGIVDFVHQQDAGVWQKRSYNSLADRTVLLLGYGGVGKAIEERLLPFETEVVRVASRARTDEHGRIHGMDELDELLPQADIVILGVPLSDATRGLADAAFLAKLQDGALVVNIARGPVVDTDALLAELNSGRLRAAIDVTDPEPLPEGHPLWSAPNLLISPHVGGATSAMWPRLVKLIVQQIERTKAGEEPVNVVLRS